MIQKKLKEYIKKFVFPRYEKFHSHGLVHVKKVIKDSLLIAKHFDVDMNMVYTVAAYHDSGLIINRENHEAEGGNLLAADTNLLNFFSPEQINIMKEAVEDHRGSRKEKPRNIYGCIVSDADRDFDIKTLAWRQTSTSIKLYWNQIKTFNEHFERSYSYYEVKRNKNKEFNLWTNNPVLIKRKNKFEKDFNNKAYTYKVYKKVWDKFVRKGTINKILNYYEDF